VLFVRSRLIVFPLAAALTACGSDSSRNPVKAAFAQRPRIRVEAPVVFRFPDRPGAGVRVYRVPRLEEVTFRFNTPGLAAARIIGYSEDDDQIYLVSLRGTLISLDLGTGRSRTVDSSLAATIPGPTGTPFIVHTDGTVAMIEHRAPVAWPTAKLEEPPAAIIGAGRASLMVETRSQGKRYLLTLSPSRATVRQEIPEGPAVASQWGDAVFIATDSGLVMVNPSKIQPPGFKRMAARPTAMALSPSSHRIYAAEANRLVIFDRSTLRQLERAELPGSPAEIRPDPWGRYLLLRPAAGDSIWLFDMSANRYIATVGGSWGPDLPTVAADGSILSRRGNDVVAVAGDSLTTSGRVRGAGTDLWVSVSWDPRRPALQLAEEAEPSAAPTGDVLFVQVSMSQNETFAEDLAQNLRRSGMNASVLPPAAPDDGYRVVLGPYPTREAAEDAGRKLGKPFWVFTRGQAPSPP
jgi:hypothetical protein